MKLKVIACGVFEPEFSHLASRAPAEVHLHFLDAGLHATPEVLRERVQEQIDAAVGRDYSGIIVGYGLCGRGTSGLIARDTPVVLPRVHDCMTLFLGSREEYRRQFSRAPGTFYTTPGWYEKKTSTEDFASAPQHRDVRQDPRFAQLAHKYGEANAAEIIAFYDSWKRNYTRAAFIDTGVGKSEQYARYAQGMAELFGWTYERLQGDTTLLEDLLAGRWDDDRVLVLQPGQRSMLTGDERIFVAVDTASSRPAAVRAPARETAGEPLQEQDGPSTGGPLLALGIDAGGTYTDCVLYDLANERVLAKAKAPTTHHDLMIGIEEALDALCVPDPTQVRLVALSTTLATNSIVEGRGGTPGAILMHPTPFRPGDIPWQPLRVVSGAMGIDGTELCPPNPEEIETVVDELLAAGVDAFAVSGYGSVKNPAHELMVKEIIRSRCDLPIVCGHELSSRLNYLNRANTAILNARLLPVIRELLEAAERSLARRGVRATLMVVKGDGSLINRGTALERPIETILSGPAASISGARHLTGLQDAIVLDMGGTTTDTAIIEGGMPRINPEGAQVGGWQTSVEAVDIATVGLGGDSYLSFTPDRKLLVGPRRVVPLACLAARYPQARSMLMALDAATMTDRSTPAALDFFLLARPTYSGAVDPPERKVIDALRQGPLPRRVLAAAIGSQIPSLPQLRRLEQLGVVIRSALTPTDLLHVTGEYAAWDVEAAAHGARVFADLYGVSVEELAEQVRQAVVERLAGQVLAKEFPGTCAGDPDDWPVLLHTALRPREPWRLRATLSYNRPIVAIGAPVRPYFPRLGELLGAQVIIPEHAEVANAIGAVASQVVVREQAVIRPGEIANYVVHARSGRTEHERLEDAVETAKRETAWLAQTRARQSGTASQQVRHRVDERRAYSSTGEEVLVEVRVEATVSGRPQLEPAPAW